MSDCATLHSPSAGEMIRRPYSQGATLQRTSTEDDSRRREVENFSCNICLDLANNAVLATCGHLFCWHCLYQWLLVSQICPVCRGACDVDSVTPIYGRRGGDTAAGAGQTAQPMPRKESRTFSNSSSRPLHILDALILPSIHPPTMPTETPARPAARRLPAPAPKQPIQASRPAEPNPVYALFGRWGTRPPAHRPARGSATQNAAQPPTHFNPLILFAAAFALLALRQMQWDPLGLSGASTTLSGATSAHTHAHKWTAGAAAAQGDDVLVTPTGKAMCALAAIIIASVWFH